jgi:hypothetical protein
VRRALPLLWAMTIVIVIVGGYRVATHDAHPIRDARMIRLVW